MIIHKSHLCTKLEVWEPRYHDKAALVKKRKVDFASPVIIFSFPKSNSYKDGRYCMTKQKAMRYPIEPHGNSEVYVIPMADFEPWETAAEVRDIALGLWDD